MLFVAHISVDISTLPSCLAMTHMGYRNCGIDKAHLQDLVSFGLVCEYVGSFLALFFSVFFVSFLFIVMFSFVSISHMIG